MSIELDHLFVFVEPDRPELPYLASLGLTETYRRRHPGQGTVNICFCFQNMFLECLWITNADEARSAPVARTGLYERSQWRTRGTSPFGLAWRDAAASRQPCTIPTWPYKPPYLPAGMSIDVATDSDDPHQPMLFRSPGSTPPSEWPAEKRGTLQESAGLGRVLSVVMHFPKHTTPAPTLTYMAENTMLDLASAEDNKPFILLHVERHLLPAPLQITLPLLGQPST